MPSSNQFVLVIGNVDEPELLQPAAVHRDRVGMQRSLSDRTEEIGVVVNADDMASVTEPRAARQTCDSFNDRAVHTAVHKACRLVHIRPNLPMGPYRVGRYFREPEPKVLAHSPAHNILELLIEVRIRHGGRRLVIAR